MTTWATFAITDGTPTGRIDLVRTGLGVHLETWTPAIAQPKDGGVWQDGALADNRRLALRRFANVTETLALKIDGTNPNAAAVTLSQLERLLEQAQAYWTSEWPAAPVWIEAVAACETNRRYALLYGYALAGGNNPYAQPFASNPTSLIDQLTLTLEHGLWQSQPPGTGECVEASSFQTATIDTGWSTNFNTDYAKQMLTLASGRLLSSCDTGKEIWRTDDGGATVWTASAAVSDGGLALIEGGAYVYYATFVNGLYRSNNAGVTWANVAADRITNLTYRPQDGYLYGLHTATTEQLTKSTNLGATWVDQTVTPTHTHIGELACNPVTGLLVAITYDGDVYTNADGLTWTYRSTLPTHLHAAGVAPRMYFPGDGYFYVFPISHAYYYRSLDGLAWEAIATPAPIGTNYVLCMTRSAVTGALYIGNQAGTVGVYKSTDGGYSWVLVCAGDCFGLTVWPGNDRAYGGFNYLAANSIKFSGTAATADLGQPATCQADCYLTNQNAKVQLTHSYVYDATGPTWTAQFPAAAFPFNLLPAVPEAPNDCIYFGVLSTASDPGPFNNLVFNLTATMGATAWTIVWEYGTGLGAWSTLPVADNTRSFGIVGVNSVHWMPPANWVATLVNGTTAWWVRARLSAITVAVSAPQQGLRNVYVVNRPTVSIAAAEVNGDLPALLHLWLANKSDLDGAGGSAPDAWANRYLVGVRSLTRGLYFQPFLNFSDTQLFAGVAVAGTAATVAAANPQTATGRQYTHTGTGTSTWANQFTLTLSPAIAASYSGRFRLFLRAQQSNGAAGDVRVRMKMIYGSGGLNFTGDWVSFAGNADWQLLDLGSFKFPPLGVKSSDLGNQMQFVVQIWSSAARTVNLYDLALMPTDEWSGDFVDGALSSGSEVGAGYQFDLDSVSYPREHLRALVRAIGSDAGLIRGVYQPIAAGPAILQANADQRLHVLAARYSGGVWSSEPWLAHSIRLQAAFRYLSMRGDR